MAKSYLAVVTSKSYPFCLKIYEEDHSICLYPFILFMCDIILGASGGVSLDWTWLAERSQHRIAGRLQPLGTAHPFSIVISIHRIIKGGQRYHLPQFPRHLL
jgi:hypothetical protein